MLIKYEGSKFHVNLKNSIEFHLFKLFIKKKIGKLIAKPYITDDYLKFAQKILNRNSSAIVVDVGCNIGTTVIPLAIKYPKATFYAIEPHPLASYRFIKNCEINDIENVKLISCAIGEENSLAKIWTCPNNSGGHRLTGFKGRKDLECFKTFEPISIPMKTLKEIFKNFNIKHCDILKIDTEGYETRILKSLENLLCPDNIKYIIAEIGSEGLEKAGSSITELFSIVKERKFKCMLLQDKKEIYSDKDIPILGNFIVKDLMFYSN